MSEKILRECPFCGKMPRAFGVVEKVQCINEDCSNAYSRPLTLEAWNMRPIEDALQERIVELEEAAMELLNSIPHSELEIARECIGNTNFSVITNCKHKLVRALRKDVNDDRA